jgi:uncharacterized LabA/DUF88 family protein
LGKFLAKKSTCRSCGHSYIFHEEKQTDVDIATQMIRDVVLDRCDITILVSADSDLIPPINFIREYNPNHKIIVYFPPKRFSNDLKTIANTYLKLEHHRAKFELSFLPNPVTLANGYQLGKPVNWP